MPDLGLSCRAMKTLCASTVVVVLLGAGPTLAATYPAPVEGDYIVRNFRFGTGEVLPELRLHYRTLGTPRRDQAGVVEDLVARDPLASRVSNLTGQNN